MYRNSSNLMLFWCVGWLSFLAPASAQTSLAPSRFAATSVNAKANDGFRFEIRSDRLNIFLDDQPVADFVFEDQRILRPYFANARLTNGLLVTRNHPPQPGIDAVDHDTMHPGIWLGFGDINGHDFWRNAAPMEHLRFVSEPRIRDGQLQFATECRLNSSTGEPLCLLTNDYVLVERPSGWMLSWQATFLADSCDIVFGDQEEMGFGVRVATPIAEKNGGRIVNSHGEETAKTTWGNPAKWCQYACNGATPAGVLVMAGENFRDCWWHNRDYGLMVANPFGREAMHQGEKSAVRVARGESLRLRFGVMVHANHGSGELDAGGSVVDLEREYRVFQSLRE